MVCLLLLTFINGWHRLRAVYSRESNKGFLRSETGVWDFRDMFTDETFIFNLWGPVEFIPDAILTPEEFAAREDEAVIGHPHEISKFATSRMRILLPDNGYYAFTRRSLEYSHRLFVNGELAMEKGSPGETRETTIHDTGQVFVILKAEDGVIELIQQSSNFAHKDGGTHSHWIIAPQDLAYFIVSDFYNSVLLGAYLALFVVHIFLFILFRRVKVNLYLALLCLTWFLRTGVTWPKIFTHIFPFMTWAAKFRIEYMAIPIGAVLIVAMLDLLFPKILHKGFRYALYAVSALVSGIFLFGDTVFMSHVVLYCYAVYIPAIVYLIIIFIIRLRKLNLEQCVFLAGVFIFAWSAIKAIDYYTGINFFNASDETSIAMFLLTLCQAGAIFIVTFRELKTTAAENAALKEQTRIIEQQLVRKREYYAEIIKLFGLKIHDPADSTYCENPAANSTVQYFINLAQKEGVPIKTELDISKDTGSLSSIDLCIIIGNLLENALDHTRFIKNEERFISISSCIEDGFLKIEVINSFNGQWHGERSVEKETRITSIPNEGAGLSSVKAICRKNHGMTEFEITDTTWKVAAFVNADTVKESHQYYTDAKSAFRKVKLSKREIGIAGLLINEGLNAKEIADRLFITPGTVRLHIFSIYKKFNVNTRGEFMALFVQRED